MCNGKMVCSFFYISLSYVAASREIETVLQYKGKLRTQYIEQNRLFVILQNSLNKVQ